MIIGSVNLTILIFFYQLLFNQNMSFRMLKYVEWRKILENKWDFDQKLEPGT